MQRIIIVYSPHSSHYIHVKRDVLEPARQLKGYLIGKYQVKQASVDTNAAALAQILQDNDLVISAGGDGTATMTVNAIIHSGKRVTLGVLGYGNFNDLAHTLRIKTFNQLITQWQAGQTTAYYPLEARINDQHYRYAACYFTVGLFAESTTVFDNKKTRHQLESGHRGLFYSIRSLAGWYFQNHRREFITQSVLNSTPLPNKTTDIIALNTPHMAKIMRGDKCYLQGENYLSTTVNLSNLPRLSLFMTKSMFGHVTKNYSHQDIIKFATPTTISIQAEGEYQQLHDVKTLEFKKSKKPLHVVTKG